MNTAGQTGFTLWELLMSMLVVGIILGFGVPNMLEFQRNGAMSAAANQLVTGLLMARAEAVKRQVPVTLCLSANPTAAAPTCSPNPVGNAANLGFIVWVDDNGNLDPVSGAPIITDGTDGNAVVDATETLVLMQSAAPGGAILSSANCGYVSFAPNGFPRDVPGLCGGNNRTVLFCDDRGNRVAAGSLSTARVVRIEPRGRGNVGQEVAEVTAAIAGPLAGVAPACP